MSVRYVPPLLAGDCCSGTSFSSNLQRHSNIFLSAESRFNHCDIEVLESAVFYILESLLFCLTVIFIVKSLMIMHDSSFSMMKVDMTSYIF